MIMLLALTLATGAVDAVSYVSLHHVFTANMSGNMALIGIGLATSIHEVLGNVYAFAGFVVGSAAIGRFIRSQDHGPLRTLARGLLLELSLLLVLIVIVTLGGAPDDPQARYLACVLLAAAMGLQTGLARHLAVADVNTTVATMTLHGLVADSRFAGGTSTRWRRRASVVLALFVGAAIGAALDRQVAWGGLAFTSAIVAVVMAVAGAVARRASQPEPTEAS